MSTRSDEVYDGRRCAVCEQRFESGDYGQPIGDMGERAHNQCPPG